jgi:hypothetical protein
VSCAPSRGGAPFATPPGKQYPVEKATSVVVQLPDRTVVLALSADQLSVRHEGDLITAEIVAVDPNYASVTRVRAFPHPKKGPVMASRGIDAQHQESHQEVRPSSYWRSNAVNRKLRPRVVDAYRRDMEARPLEDDRRADPNLPVRGMLLNGQHRLTALATSDKAKSQEFLVVTGLDDKARWRWTRARTRCRGRPEDRQRPRQERHRRRRPLSLDGGAPRTRRARDDHVLKQKISIAESVDAYDTTPTSSSSQPTAPCSCASTSRQRDRARLLLPPVLAGRRRGMQRVLRRDVDMSFSAKGDPRKAALKRLTMMASDPNHAGTSQTQSVVVISVLTRAWNYWRKGEEVDTIPGRNTKGQIIDPVQPI